MTEFLSPQNDSAASNLTHTNLKQMRGKNGLQSKDT